MSVVTITVEGKEALLVGLSRFADRVRNWTPTFEKFADTAFGIFRRRFEVAGPGWPPLAPSTEAEKAREVGGPSRILIRTGDLYGSFVQGAKDNILRISPQSAEFGSSDPKGPFHQEGGGRLPQRTIIEITGDDELKFERIALSDLAEEAKGLGFEVAA